MKRVLLGISLPNMAETLCFLLPWLRSPFSVWSPGVTKAALAWFSRRVNTSSSSPVRFRRLASLVFHLGGQMCDSLLFLLAPFASPLPPAALSDLALLDSCCRLAADKVAAHFAASPCAYADLFSLFHNFKIVSWNLTSAVGISTDHYKLGRIRRWLDLGFVVLLQETHVGRRHLPPFVGQFAHSRAYYVDAVDTDKGGTTGGLCFLVPTNLGIEVQGDPTTVVEGHVAFLDLTWQGLQFRLWNIYLSVAPGQRTQQIACLKDTHNRQPSPNEKVHVAIGDLNLDGARPKDNEQWIQLRKFMQDIGVFKIPLTGNTYLAPAADGSCGKGSCIDHAFATKVEQRKDCRTKDRISLDWTLRTEGLVRKSMHLPILLSSMRVFSKKPLLDRRNFVPVSAFTMPTVARTRLYKKIQAGLARYHVPTGADQQDTHSSAFVSHMEQVTLRDDLPAGMCLAWMTDEITNWHRRNKYKLPMASPIAACRKALGNAAPDGDGNEYCRILLQDWYRIHSTLALAAPEGDTEGDIVKLPIKWVDTAIRQFEETQGKVEMTGGNINQAANCRAVYSRMRKLVPKIVKHDERLQDEHGQLTDDPAVKDDLYLKARKFWFDEPPVDQAKQDKLLEWYVHARCDHPPLAPELPKFRQVYRIVMRTPDSQPGDDGLPFAAWRLFASAIAVLIIALLKEIKNNGAPRAPDRVVLIRWIPKKVWVSCPDGQRPLGLPKSIYRILDAVLLNYMQEVLAPCLHPSQVLLSGNCEATTCAEKLQKYLDNASLEPRGGTVKDNSASQDMVQWLLEQKPAAAQALQRLSKTDTDLRLAVMADLKQAFERISQQWIRKVLLAHRPPEWLTRALAFLSDGRTVRFILGGQLGPKREVKCGVDQGGNTSPFQFMIGIDPLIALIECLPGIDFSCGFMDDMAAAAPLLGAILFQVVLDVFKEAVPMTLTYHSCWKSEDGQEGSSPSELVLRAKQEVTRGQFALRINGPQFCGDCRSDKLGEYLLDWKQAPCGCNSKLVMVPHRALRQDELACLDGTPWGLNVVQSNAVYLGIVVTSWEAWGIGDDSFCLADEAVEHARARLNYVGPMAKAALRISQLAKTKVSPLQKGNAWNVYVITLFSYVAQLYLPTADVCSKMDKHLWHYLGHKWLGVGQVTCLRTLLGHSAAPQGIWEYACGIFANRWCRARNDDWYYEALALAPQQLGPRIIADTLTVDLAMYRGSDDASEDIALAIGKAQQQISDKGRQVKTIVGKAVRMRVGQVNSLDATHTLLERAARRASCFRCEPLNGLRSGPYLARWAMLML